VPPGGFVPALAAADLPPGSCREALVSGKAVAIFNVDGAFHAIDNRCIHRGGPLGQGALDGSVVYCPWHAWTYDVTTGANTVNPEMSVARYDVRVEDGQVLVKIE
jgi:3-phenylpropionate/trans-cinnamate dioxygenase ferredoxin component